MDVTPLLSHTLSDCIASKFKRDCRMGWSLSIWIISRVHLACCHFRQSVTHIHDSQHVCFGERSLRISRDNTFHHYVWDLNLALQKKSSQSPCEQVPGTHRYAHSLLVNDGKQLPVFQSGLFQGQRPPLQCSGQHGLSINSAEYMLDTLWQIFLWLRNKIYFIWSWGVIEMWLKGHMPLQRFFFYGKHLFLASF